MWPLTGNLRALSLGAAVVLVFAAGFATAWRWQASNILDLKLAQSEASRKGWESALTLYRQSQAHADLVVTDSQTTITGLRGELASAKAKLRAAQRTSPECQQWSAQAIACPH